MDLPLNKLGPECFYHQLTLCYTNGTVDAGIFAVFCRIVRRLPHRFHRCCWIQSGFRGNKLLFALRLPKSGI